MNSQLPSRQTVWCNLLERVHLCVIKRVKKLCQRNKNSLYKITHNMSSFQASSTLYSPEYYKSGHSVGQNMYIVNTSTGHTCHTFESVHTAHKLTNKQMHKQEQEDDRRHKEQVQKRHKAMMDRRHGHGHD